MTLSPIVPSTAVIDITQSLFEVQGNGEGGVSVADLGDGVKAAASPLYQTLNFLDG